MHLAQNVAQHAEQHHQHQVEGGAVHRVHPNRRDGGDGRDQEPQGNGQHTGEQADQRDVHYQQHHVGDQQGGNQTPDDIGLFSKHRRTRGDVIERQRAHHYRRGAGARHAEGQHRDKRAAGRGVIRRLRRRHAADIAFAEAVAVTAQLFLGHVGDGAGDSRPRAGQNADEETDHRRTQGGTNTLRPLFGIKEHTSGFTHQRLPAAGMLQHQ